MPFVRVALDLPIPRLFDYIAPKTESEILPGTRVLVPFGARRHVGLVIETVDAANVGADKLKEVFQVLSDTPPLSGPPPTGAPPRWMLGDTWLGTVGWLAPAVGPIPM